MNHLFQKLKLLGETENTWMILKSYIHWFAYYLVTYHGVQVTFHYVGYNESGRRIDSTYLQGSPAKIRMGTKSLVPG